MATQGRKNVHGKGGVRFKAAYTTSKYNSMMRTLVSQLILSEKVVVTAPVGRDLKALMDKMVTLGKKGDLAARRQAARTVRVMEASGVSALKKLFDELAPRYKERNGGYTSVLKLNNRKGDNAPMVMVTLVK